MFIDPGLGGKRQRSDIPQKNAAATPIRLMIVDDSIVARTVIKDVVESRPGFEVVAVAPTADRALALLADHSVDIILLDLEMPGMDGLTALPGILAASKGAHVLIVSSAAGDGAAATMKALTLGAADTMLKPKAGRFAGHFADALVDRLQRIGHARSAEQTAGPVARPKREEAGFRRAPGAPPLAAPIGCIAVGASTGGLHALSAFFRALPAHVDAPILVTQHLPAEFMPYFADQLRDIAGRAAKVASDGSRLQPGELLIAPGDAHMRLIQMRDGVRVRLDRSASASGCLPSVDPMFAAVAERYGPTGLGVVLSGMGRDGMIGAGAIVAAGGEVLAQDVETSVVWGMPGAVANAGFAAAVLPPERIAGRIEERWKARNGSKPWK